MQLGGQAVLVTGATGGIGNAIGTYFIELARRDMEGHMASLPDRDLAYFREGTDHFDEYVRAVAWAQAYAAANRDPREFGPTAETFDLRRRIAKILTFSYGTHYCIGAAAARLQGRIVIEELLRRCPDFTVDVAAGRYAEGNYVRRHLSLPWRAG